MATRGAREPRTGRTEPAGKRAVPDGLRRLRELLELRQRQLRSRIAACEELRAEMAALWAALSPGPAGGVGPRGAPEGTEDRPRRSDREVWGSGNARAVLGARRER